MKFKKENRKFYVNGVEVETFEKAWAEIKKVFGEMSKDFKEYIKTLQTRIANQKGLLWFVIALTNEETQYLLQRIDETYGEYNEQ